jgi:hypothetical protein
MSCPLMSTWCIISILTASWCISCVWGWCELMSVMLLISWVQQRQWEYAIVCMPCNVLIHYVKQITFPSRLVEASRKGDLSEVQRLLAAGMSTEFANWVSCECACGSFENICGWLDESSYPKAVKCFGFNLWSLLENRMSIRSCISPCSRIFGMLQRLLPSMARVWR